eukprot:c915_g1_i1.p1 GENE.c915_g1_i1~~c915_g1_i1.p1  ORF type:complete len:574 (+),score=149.16 c915_g1_i1:43-1722(+)
MRGVVLHVVYVLVIAAQFAGTGAVAPVFASSFGSNMVLQAGGKGSTVWGYAMACDGLVVTFNSHLITPDLCDNHLVTKSNFVYRWRAVLPTTPAGSKPYNISVSDESTKESSTLKNVLFGEVWVCSGQSNMAFLLENAFNGTEQVTNSTNYPLIRLFAVKKVTSQTAQDELGGVELPWSIASPAATSMNHHQSIAFRVDDDNWLYFSAVCWFFGKELFDKLRVPIGLVESTWGGTAIESWSSQQSLRSCGAAQDRSLPLRAKKAGVTESGSEIYNSMIHPLMNMTIKGVAWYQGEGNEDNALKYNCTFPAMIADWRKSWASGTSGITNDSFPFGFVQLSTQAADDTFFAAVRWAQTASVGYVPNPAMPNTFMAVTFDLGDSSSPYGSVHPRYKSEVGQRLSLGALAIAYPSSSPPPHSLTSSLPFSGPIMASLALHNSTTLSVQFQGHPPSSQVELRNSNPLLWEVCAMNSSLPVSAWCSLDSRSGACALNDSVGWKAVTAVALDSGSEARVLLTSSHTPTAPLCVRYAWATNPPCGYEKCAVYSNNLPSPTAVLVLKL